MTHPNDSYRFTVEADDHKTRMDKYLSAQIDNITRSRVQSLIQEKAVICNGQSITDCAYKIKEGDKLEIIVPEIKELDIQPKPEIILNVAYEDDDLLIIDKQAGLTVHPGAGTKDDTLVHALLAHCKDSLSGIGGVQRPGIVHRLDRDTTGLMVIAKNDQAHVTLSQQIQSRELTRIYHAIVWGTPSPPVGKIESYINRNNNDRTKMVATKGQGKHAVTKFKVLERFGDGIASLIQCKLETGRTHQIRVHMQFKGFPLIGDPVYGKNPNNHKGFNQLPDNIKTAIKQFGRQALHSSYIAFEHPITGEPIECKSYPSDGHPQDIYQLIELLRSL